MTATKTLFSLTELDCYAQSVFRRYWPQFLSCIAIFAFLYFSEFSDYRLRVDEELAAQRESGLFWISFGRWGTAIIEEYFLLRPLNPYFSMLSFALSLTASFFTFCKAIRINPSPSVILSFALFAGFPSWYYLIEFKATLVANGLAVLFSSLAGYFFLSRQRLPALLSVASLTAAVSIYQSSVFIAITISLAALFLGRDTATRTFSVLFHSMLKLAGLILVSVLLYFLIWKSLLIRFNLEPQYISSFLNLSAFKNDPLAVIQNTLREALSLFFGTHQSFYGLAPLTGVLFSLGLASFAIHQYQSKKTISGVLISLVLLLILMLIPFSLHLLSGGHLPNRSNLAAPFVYWFVVVMALQTPYLSIQLTSKALMFLIAIQYVQLSSFSSFSHYFVSVHDQLTASQVYQRVTSEIGNFDRNRPYPIEIVGPLPFPEAGRGLRGGSAVTGSSIFEWDGGNPHRSTAFLHSFGMGKFTIIDDQERASIISQVEKMPLWPDKDSVRIVNGVIVVKFGEYTERQRGAIEKSAR